LPEVLGDLSGIRNNIIEQLRSLYELSVPYGQIVTNELAESLATLTCQINREIAVYLNRRGQVTIVAVGDQRTVSLPDVNGRRAKHRLSGIRCLHTHPGGNSLLSPVDVATLKELHFDLMAAIGVDNNEVAAISIGFIAGIVEDKEQVEQLGPLTLADIIAVDLVYLLSIIEHKLETSNKTHSLREEEVAILVGVERKGNWDVEDSLNELAELAITAGATIVGRFWQKRDKPDSALFIGRGKVQEISLAKQELNANLVIFDDDLSPAQQRNLEQMMGVKVVDRTGLILDIFAQRARTHEGKLQVELAQLRYILPRLGGQGLVLSRLGGGIGTRGPGETKLEVDRRRVRSRISDIETEIKNVKKQRLLHREQREKNNLPTVSLVGYTNAGKSTLLNALTQAGVLAEDKLFATLDPTTRKIVLPSGREVLLTDTVGFIQKLPHQLVAAFQATLEEVIHTDLLLHVIDASHPLYKQQSDAVWQVLKELHCEAKTAITLYNKIDKITEPDSIARMTRLPGSIALSVLHPDPEQGLQPLLELIEEYLPLHWTSCSLNFPYSDSGELAKLYEIAKVVSADYQEQGILVKASMPTEYLDRYNQYIVEMNECQPG
jgi:GTP-binding protein HflX